MPQGAAAGQGKCVARLRTRGILFLNSEHWRKHDKELQAQRAEEIFSE